MDNSTTPQDSAAMSPASTGSVEPVAYGVIYPDGTTGAVGWKWQDCLEVAGVSDVIVPLYRLPTLTDAEREAVARLSFLLSQHGWVEDGVVLRALLERLG